MIDFFIKRKEIVLDCFTSLPVAFDYAPIDYAIKYFPDWWKSTPKNFIDKNSIKNETIKKCSAIIDYHRTGIVIPSWFDLQLKIDSIDVVSNRNFYWKSSVKLGLSTHPTDQFKLFHGEDGIHIKIMSAWRFYTKKKIFFTWHQPTWHMRDYMFNIVGLPGVIEFHTQKSTNINLFARYTEKQQDIRILPLTPMVVMHPLTDHNIKIVNHLVSEEELVRLDSPYYLSFLLPDQPNSTTRKYKKYLTDKIEKLGIRQHLPKGEIK